MMVLRTSYGVLFSRPLLGFDGHKTPVIYKWGLTAVRPFYPQVRLYMKQPRSFGWVVGDAHNASSIWTPAANVKAVRAGRGRRSKKTNLRGMLSMTNLDGMGKQKFRFPQPPLSSTSTISSSVNSTSSRVCYRR